MYQERIKNNHLADVGGVGELAKKIAGVGCDARGESDYSGGIVLSSIPLPCETKTCNQTRALYPFMFFQRDYHKIMQQNAGTC